MADDAATAQAVELYDCLVRGLNGAEGLEKAGLALWPSWLRRQKWVTPLAMRIHRSERAVRLYFQLLVEGNFDSEAVLVFVKQLSRHLRAPMALVWNRSKTHRGAEVRSFLDLARSRQFHFPS